MIRARCDASRRRALIDVAQEAGVARVTAAQVLNGTGGAGVRVGEATAARVLASRAGCTTRRTGSRSSSKACAARSWASSSTP
jgi:hypothetical protein